jgi:1-acyl-sn-glycerol-3-phosphate acyltransferase
VPVFVTGLINDLPRQVLGNWTGGEKVRIWFGEPVDLSEFYSKRNAIRTHTEIGDHLMERIAELGQRDRDWNEQGERDEGTVL